MNLAKISNFIDAVPFQSKIPEKSPQSTDNPTSNSDSVEISDDAHNLQSTTREDSLLINKSGNNFVIHFDNHEILQRTIKRGFLIVDDKKILLSDADKEKLAEIGEKVRQANEKSYMQALMKSESEVAQHNSEIMDRIARKDKRLMQTAARMMKGEQVSAEDEQELLLSDPKLYAMAKSAGAMQKMSDEDRKTSRKNHDERIRDSEPLNYDMSIPKYKKFETQMVLSREESDFKVETITSAAIN